MTITLKSDVFLYYSHAVDVCECVLYRNCYVSNCANQFSSFSLFFSLLAVGGNGSARRRGGSAGWDRRRKGNDKNSVVVITIVPGSVPVLLLVMVVARRMKASVGGGGSGNILCRHCLGSDWLNSVASTISSRNVFLLLGLMPHARSLGCSSSLFLFATNISQMLVAPWWMPRLIEEIYPSPFPSSPCPSPSFSFVKKSASIDPFSLWNRFGNGGNTALAVQCSPDRRSLRVSVKTR